MRKEVLELEERFGKEYAGRYLFQEIIWAKRSHITQKYTKYYPLTGQVQNSDFIAIQAERIWGSLREQPPDKPISLEKLLSENNGIPIEAFVTPQEADIILKSILLGSSTRRRRRRIFHMGTQNHELG